MEKIISTKLILLIAIIASLFAFAYFSSTDQSLIYRDAKSHLNIARRVVFSQTPGLAQLGGTWLPLPHVFMLPLIWHDFSYYSGIAGIIPSMISFVVLVVMTFKSVLLFTKDKLASFMAAFLILINPSVLYLQSTPMSELPFLALSTTSIYFMLKWVFHRNYVDIVLSALFICLSTLTRYDAWFLFISQIGIILLIGIIARSWKKIEGHLFLFIFLGGFGILLWLIYNHLIFGNILNFAVGQGSGSWDTSRVSNLGNYAAKSNLAASLMTYLWLAIDNNGIFLLFLACIGFVVYLFRQRSIIYLVGSFLFLSSFIFNVVSLYLGQSVAMSKHIPPFETYNLRYGTAIIASVGFYCGLLCSWSKFSKILIGMLLVTQAYLFYVNPLEILEDAKVGNIEAERKVAVWIRENPAKGNTLLSTLAHDPLLFDSRISMENLIYEGNQHLWTGSLISPEKYVSRIVFKESDKVNDAVRKALYNKPVLSEKYTLSYDDGDYKVYDKNNN